MLRASSRGRRWLAGLAAALALAATACTRPAPAHPALWLVEGPHGQKAWLFGTIHALPEPYDWRGARIDGALAASDRLVVEVAGLNDDKTTARIFADLAKSPNLAPLAERAAPADRAALRQAMTRLGLAPAQLDGMETWAAALSLQQAASQASGIDSGNGVDRALLANYSGRIEELEGAGPQLAIFDRLAEDDQRALLHAVLAGDNDGKAEAARLARAWARADLAAIDRETSGELLDDPELREALLTNRNAAWAGRLAAMLNAGARPFVAVGTAHLVGPEGLPALLVRRGYRVTRLQ